MPADLTKKIGDGREHEESVGSVTRPPKNLQVFFFDFIHLDTLDKPCKGSLMCAGQGSGNVRGTESRVVCHCIEYLRKRNSTAEGNFNVVRCLPVSTSRFHDFDWGRRGLLSARFPRFRAIIEGRTSR